MHARQSIWSFAVGQFWEECPGTSTSANGSRHFEIVATNSALRHQRVLPD